MLVSSVARKAVFRKADWCRHSYSTSSQSNAVGKPLYEPPEGPKPAIPCRRCSSLKDMSLPALLRLATKPLVLAEHTSKRQQPLNILLTILGWIPGIVHALFVVHNHLAEKRNQAVINAIEKKGNE